MEKELDKHVRAYEGKLLYDFDNHIQLKWYPQRVLKYAQDKKSLLELGLGHGITTNLFSKHFSRHVVLDGSSAVIENFHKAYPDCNVEIIETYFEDFVSEEKFDLIVMGYVLEHVNNPSEILKHFKKFLAPNGVVFVSVPNAEVLNRRLGHIAGMLPDMQLLSDHDLLLGHKRYFTIASITEEVQHAGYEIERMEGIYLKPFTTQQIISLNFDNSIIDALCEVGIDYPELCCGMLAQLKIA